MSRVLILSDHALQIDRRITAQANALVRSGREVTLVTVPTHIPPGSLDPAIRVCSAPASTLSAGGWRRSLNRVLPSAATDLLRSARYGLFRPGRRTVAYLRDRSPIGPFDAIHCHDLPTLPAAVELRQARWSRARIIFDTHELFPSNIDNRAYERYWQRIETRFVGAADAVIAINPSIADHLAHRYQIETPAVLYNSVDPEQRAERVDLKQFLRHFGAPEKGFAVLFQGWFSEGRNLEALVRAFERLGAGTNLYLLGRGPLERRVRSLCRRNRIDNVFFGPWVEQNALLGYTARADLGVIPYHRKHLLNDRFCSPNKLFELMEVGVPIAASDLPELRRIVAGSGIGWVYPMGSPEEIAAAIADARSRVEAGEVDEARFAAARERYGWAAQERTLLEVYERLGA